MPMLELNHDHLTFLPIDIPWEHQHSSDQNIFRILQHFKLIGLSHILARIFQRRKHQNTILIPFFGSQFPPQSSLTKAI